jgi:hypothetical protein
MDEVFAVPVRRPHATIVVGTEVGQNEEADDDCGTGCGYGNCDSGGMLVRRSHLGCGEHRSTGGRDRGHRCAREPGRNPTGALDSNGRYWATITQSSCGSGDGVWVYDQSSCPESPDYILCLTGSGTDVSLHNWWSLIYSGGIGFHEYWDTRVASFLPISDSGALLDDPIDETQSFSAYGDCQNADSPDHMNAVTLD